MCIRDRDSIQVSESALFKVQVFDELGCFVFDSTKVIKEPALIPVILGIVDLCDNDTVSYTHLTLPTSDLV